MISLALKDHDSSESQALDQVSTSSEASSIQHMADSVFPDKMPQTQILSYLIPHVLDSEFKDSDLYDTFIKHTAGTDPSIKGSLPTDNESNIITFPIQFKARQRQDFFTSLQAWEGIVLEILDNGFLARLIDLTHTGVDEEAEFSMIDVSDDDKLLVQPEAIFYWDIGYHTNYSGQRTRSSFIRFRRLPSWTQREIDAAKREADRIGKVVGWQ